MRTSLATLLLYGLGLAILAWKVIEPMWPYLVLGALLASASWGLKTRFLAWKLSETQAVWATFVSVGVLFVLPVTILAWRLVADTAAFVSGLNIQDVSARLKAVAQWSHDTFGVPASVDENTVTEFAATLVTPLRGWLAEWLPKAFATLGWFAVGLIVTGLVVYYLLKQGPALVEELKAASPLDDGLEDRLLNEAKNLVDGVLLGQAVSAFLQGLLGFLAFAVLGIPNALFWGFVMAVLSFLPLVGAFLVWAPAAVFLFVNGSTLAGIGLVVWGVVAIGSIDNFVKPIIIGQRGQLHPVLAFVGVLGGLAAFGFMGFVLGPLVLSLASAVFRVLADTDWDEMDRRERRIRS